METQVREHNLPLPKNQQQEVLYELLKTQSTTSLSLTKKYFIMNVPDVVFRLRRKGLDIANHERNVTNKFGRKVKTALWQLVDKKMGMELYSKLA